MSALTNSLVGSMYLAIVTDPEQPKHISRLHDVQVERPVTRSSTSRLNWSLSFESSRSKCPGSLDEQAGVATKDSSEVPRKLLLPATPTTP